MHCLKLVLSLSTYHPMVRNDNTCSIVYQILKSKAILLMSDCTSSMPCNSDTLDSTLLRFTCNVWVHFSKPFECVRVFFETMLLCWCIFRCIHFGQCTLWNNGTDLCQRSCWGTFPRFSVFEIRMELWWLLLINSF